MVDKDGLTGELSIRTAWNVRVCPSPFLPQDFETNWNLEGHLLSSSICTRDRKCYQ